MLNRRELVQLFGGFALVPKVFGRALLAPGQRSPMNSRSSLRTVAGVPIPDTKIALEATSLAKEVSPPFLFNHAMRTYLFGALTGKARRMNYDPELLYLGCILHDIGLTDRFMGDMPFELQGAEAAKRFLEERGFPKERAEIVWDGIAMHASAIGHHKRPEIALVGEGAGADVVAPEEQEIKKSEIDEIIAEFPRLRFKTAFVEVCSDVIRRHPDGAYSGFMRQIGERKVPTFHPGNICDAIAKAPFSE